MLSCTFSRYSIQQCKQQCPFNFLRVELESESESLRFQNATSQNTAGYIMHVPLNLNSAVLRRRLVTPALFKLVEWPRKCPRQLPSSHLMRSLSG